jgi:uncharacterized protein (TIGR00730 family)
MAALCVCIGARLGVNPAYIEATQKLGEGLAKNNITLIYGGSNTGLMGILADTVMKHNGKVVGFIPKHFDKKEVHTNISELHIVKSMHERKMLMAQNADGFVALPGGLGTLEEIFELINAAKLNLHTKPFFIVDINNYFSKLIEFIDYSVHEGFLTLEQRALINVIPDHKIILEKFKGLL